jgi:hypothetical protein
MPTFLKELKENELGIGTYFRIRKNDTVELGYQSKLNDEYDNTRLIIDPIPLIINNQKTFRCKVSWFNSNDSVHFPKEGKEYDEKNSHDIIVQFDIEKLVTDKNYYMFFMEKLLNKERILKYLEYGMEENPEIKCGNYIGYIGYNEQGILKRYFDDIIGIKCHYLPEKIEERKHKKEIMLKYYDNQIELLEKRLEELKIKRKQIVEENINNIIKH